MVTTFVTILQQTKPYCPIEYQAIGKQLRYIAKQPLQPLRTAIHSHASLNTYYAVI